MLLKGMMMRLATPKISLRSKGLRSDEQAKLDKIRALGMKDNPIIPQIKDFVDAQTKKTS
jgi:hypothetical protein